VYASHTPYEVAADYAIAADLVRNAAGERDIAPASAKLADMLLGLAGATSAS
jgi:hypothetical protein